MFKKYKKLYLMMFVLIFISENNIYGQELTMFPGFWSTQYYQDGIQISKKRVEELLLEDVEAIQFWQKSKQQLSISRVASIAEVGFLIWAYFRENNEGNLAAPLIGFIFSTGVSIGFELRGDNLRKRAILKYNENIDVPTLNIGQTHNGLGIVLKF